MFWEELTSTELKDAIEETKGVCIFPFGVIEKHGSHLPLSTDMIIGRTLAAEAVKLESAVIFPYYFFGQIAEGRHTPGTISIKPELMYSLLENVFEEISRNGFHKILLFESHGGNCSFVDYFMLSTLYRKHNYTLYHTGISEWMTKEQTEEILHLTQRSDLGGHAGDMETAIVLAARDDLVHLDQVDKEGIPSLGRLDHLNGMNTPINWYADHPFHQQGDPFGATKEAGEKIIEYTAANLAKKIKAIKQDTAAPKLLNEFYVASEQL